MFERRCHERATVLESAARTFVNVASRHFDVVAAYAFRSVDERRVGLRSNFDLLVVRKTSITEPMRGADLVCKAALGVELDLIVVTPVEYRERLPTTSFGRSILASARRIDAA